MLGSKKSSTMQCVYCEVRTIWKTVPVSHLGIVALVQSQSVCNLWWTGLHRDRFLIDPVSIILPMFHTHLRPHVALTRMTNGRRLETVTKQCCFRNRGALGNRALFWMWVRGEGVIAEAVSRRCKVWASLRENSVGQSSTGTGFCLFRFSPSVFFIVATHFQHPTASVRSSAFQRKLC
jgi:hypothetical protein